MTMGNTTLIRLNLGAGGHDIPGFIPIDRKNGQEVYPLEGYEDGTVDEIRASHVLEHFPYEKVPEVVRHWVAKLKPGGTLRIAVPDFDWIAKKHTEGALLNAQGFVMGGHTDENDCHAAIFNRESLTELLINVNCWQVRRWESEIQDCAAMDVSLNLMATKRGDEDYCVEKVCGLLSVPRYGPTVHMHCAVLAFNRLNIPLRMGQGAFWHQVLSEMLESEIEHGAEYAFTLDYDTVFQAADLLEMYRLMRCYDDVDAICSVQSRRIKGTALFTMTDKDGKPRERVSSQEFARNLTPITTGHFGLTLIRLASLKDIPRPWFMPEPNPGKRWGDHRIDADMAFWKDWYAAGKNVHIANRVVVGHIQELVTWPDKSLRPIYQPMPDYDAYGMPAEVMRMTAEEQRTLVTQVEESTDETQDEG